MECCPNATPPEQIPKNSYARISPRLGEVPGGRIRNMPEKVRAVQDFFKSADEFLHGTNSWIKMAIFAVILLVALFLSVLEITDKIKEKNERLKAMEDRYPRLFKIFYGAKLRTLLLVVIVILLGMDWRDATTISPPCPAVKPLPVPTVQFGVPKQSEPRKSEILFVQNSMAPQATPITAWQKAKNYDKPGVSMILTASGEIRHPLFTFTCNVPCIFTDGSGISTSFLAHLIKEKSTDVRIVMQLDIPAKLADGQQLEMDFRSQSDKEVEIETVQLTRP
jgi:hypothetical protein